MLVARSQLVRDLRRLGLEPGGAAMVHCRMSALGHVVGGAETVVRALLDVLGHEVLDASRAAERWSPQTFDMVTSCMALQDMPDPGAALRASFRLVKTGGRLLCSVPHPFTDSVAFREWERGEGGEKLFLKVDRYFDTDPAVCHWDMPRLKNHWHTTCWRRTLSEWSALMEEAGFLIRKIREARPTREQVEGNPDLDDCFRLPYFLIFELVKCPFPNRRAVQDTSGHHG